MTMIDAERVKELEARICASMGERPGPVISTNDMPDLLAIVGDYSTFKAENEQLKEKVEAFRDTRESWQLAVEGRMKAEAELVALRFELKVAQETAEGMSQQASAAGALGAAVIRLEAALAKQAPLIEAAMGVSRESLRQCCLYFEEESLLRLSRAALALREEKI